MSRSPNDGSPDPVPSTPVSRLTDKKLISLCLSGNADAWDALTARYESLIFTVALRMGLAHTDADDVFQNVCLLLLDHLADLRDTSRLSAWLITSTRREVWKLRRLRGMPLMSEIEIVDQDLRSAQPVGGADPLLPEQALIALENQRLVQEALSHLSDRCRKLLTYLYHNDPPLTYAETSRRLSMPIGAIGAARARCLQRLKKILDEFGF